MYIRRLSPPWVAERFYSTAYGQDLEKFSSFVFLRLSLSQRLWIEAYSFAVEGLHSEMSLAVF